MSRKIAITLKPDLSSPLTMERIGQYVRHKRTSLNMTLEDTAGLCGLSKQAYNNVEKGVENIRVETLFKALKSLGIKLKIDDDLGADDGWV